MFLLFDLITKDIIRFTWFSSVFDPLQNGKVVTNKHRVMQMSLHVLLFRYVPLQHSVSFRDHREFFAKGKCARGRGRGGRSLVPLFHAVSFGVLS